ncbi:hypothetical protein [Thalassotalea atypica]|uniref:hypothetical protein n=1 Tax=Thalassotalea atypica TaxID=2054316 RepID=UPI0025742D19|nr:hypothetical protein [Thalassotalea atypica]
MKLTFIVLAALLVAFVLYFLLNVISPKQNKVNGKLRITGKKQAAYYLAFCLMLVPLLVLGIKNSNEEALANSYGLANFESYTVELNKAQSYDLTLEQYLAAMTLARNEGFTEYTAHQNHLEAKQHNYSDYASYTRDLELSVHYGFSLAIYRQLKAESDDQNFEFFDDYLLHLEKLSLTKKLEKVASLEGDYNIESVPLGVKKNELLSLVDDCKITQIPDYSFPISNTLAPRNSAHVSHFFPETNTNTNFGLTPYSMNFTVMPGLDRQAITKYEMKCETNRYDLWFLKSDDSLVMYEKTIHMPSIRRFDDTVARIENILSAKCDAEISVGLEMAFEEYGERTIKNLYCKSFQDYIIATIVDGAIVAGVRKDPDIHIGYLSDRLWKKYISNLHAVKGKKRNVTFTLNNNNNRNQTKTIESRI